MSIYANMPRTAPADNPIRVFLRDRIHWPLVIVAALLITFGLFAIASAASTMKQGALGYLQKQIIYVAMGVAAFIGLQQVHFRTLLRYAYLVYAGMLVLLVGVLFTRPINGASCWYDLGFFSLQPAEYMKIAVILALVEYLHHDDNKYQTFWGLLAPLGLTLVPMALILKQPDLGGAITFLPLFFTLMYASGAQRRHLLGICLVGAAMAVLMWFTILKPYQKARVNAWLDPAKYRGAEAYQLNQSMIAIGSGGFWGKGYMQGTQQQLNLLPEKHTDFIFAVIAEEGGYCAVLLLTASFAALVVVGFRVALNCRDQVGRTVAVGVTGLLAGEAVINLSVVTGLMPNTGIVLPLISYGGSSMLATWMALGLLNNVACSHTWKRNETHGPAPAGA